MAQPAFQLTALDVRRFDFGRAWRGFDREHVERFRGQVAETLEALTKQVQAGEAALRAAQEELAGFRERERSLSEALVSAQQLRTDMREQAEREAQVILREAQVEAERQRHAVREELRRAEEEVQAVWRARRAHITRLRQHLERQLSELNAAEVDPVPSLVAEQVLGPPPAPDPEPPKAVAPPPPWLVDDVDQ
ncbi:MAG: DivIVA domain-containing protein [Gemmatimonadetes bacterium]|nr:DivIVA domain-containing protein [Gemmatimonadota bacterium]